MLPGTCQTVGPYQVWSKESWIETHQLTCAYPETHIHVRTHTVTEICTHVQPSLIYAHSVGRPAFAHMAVMQTNTCMRSHAGLRPYGLVEVCRLFLFSTVSPHMLPLFPFLVFSVFPLLLPSSFPSPPLSSPLSRCSHHLSCSPLPPSLLALPSSPYLLSSSAAVQTVMMSYVQSAQGWETHQSVHTDRLYIWFVFCVTAPCTGTHWERERER